MATLRKEIESLTKKMVYSRAAYIRQTHDQDLSHEQQRVSSKLAHEIERWWNQLKHILATTTDD